MLPKQHMNKETKQYSLKCPNCKIKTTEMDTHKEALDFWNDLHKKD